MKEQNRGKNMKKGTSVLVLVLSLSLSSCGPGKLWGSTATPTSTITPTATSTPSPTPTPGAGSIETSPKDGMVGVYVPEGDFLMGSPASDSLATADEKPQHTVHLDAYWMDQTEVTNAMYVLCVQAGACLPPISTKSTTHDAYYGNAQFADYPVLWVDWNDAQAYCAWAGRRLPTEAEWEKAARGTEAQAYPWGNTAPTCSLGNFGLQEGNCTGDTSKVGSYPAGASPYGALDMSGNVWEFVSDWYSDSYYSTSPGNNPTGPTSGSARGIRGGSWYFDTPRVSAGNRAWYVGPGGFNLGFRCDRTP